MVAVGEKTNEFWGVGVVLTGISSGPMLQELGGFTAVSTGWAQTLHKPRRAVELDTRFGSSRCYSKIF